MRPIDATHSLGSLSKPLVCLSNSARGSDAWNSHGMYIQCALIMQSTANTVLEYNLGQEVVRKRKRVVRKTKLARGKEKVVRGAARVVRAPPPRVARDSNFSGDSPP